MIIFKSYFRKRRIIFIDIKSN